MSSAEDDSDIDDRRRSSSSKKKRSSKKRDRHEKSRKSDEKKRSSKKRRHSDSESGSDSDSGGSDHSSGDESDHRSKKRRKSSSSSSKKERKKEKKEKKRERKERKKEKKRLKAAAAAKEVADARANGEDVIGEDDYFLKSTEFRVWLQENHRKFMDKVDSKKLRKKYFPKFIKAWNSKALDERFYKGLNASGVEQRLTKHSWAFKLDKGEEEKLVRARDTVDTETHHVKDSDPAVWFGGKKAQRSSGDSNGQKRGPPRPYKQNRGPPGETDAERFDRRDEERQLKHFNNKKHSRRVRDTLEELVPKPDPGSREAMLEKRRQKNAFTKKRSPSPEVPTEDLMGGSGGDFQRKLHNRRNNREHRAAKLQTKVDEYAKKESSTMDSLRALMAQNKHKY